MLSNQMKIGLVHRIPRMGIFGIQEAVLVCCEAHKGRPVSHRMAELYLEELEGHGLIQAVGSRKDMDDGEETNLYCLAGKAEELVAELNDQPGRKELVQYRILVEEQVRISEMKKNGMITAEEFRYWDDFFGEKAFELREEFKLNHYDVMKKLDELWMHSEVSFKEYERLQKKFSQAK